MGNRSARSLSIRIPSSFAVIKVVSNSSVEFGIGQILPKNGLYFFNFVVSLELSSLLLLSLAPHTAHEKSVQNFQLKALRVLDLFGLRA